GGLQAARFRHSPAPSSPPPCFRAAPHHHALPSSRWLAARARPQPRLPQALAALRVARGLRIRARLTAPPVRLWQPAGATLVQSPAARVPVRAEQAPVPAA